MAYQNKKHHRRNHHQIHEQYGWSPSNDYQYEAMEEAEVGSGRNYYYRPRDHHEVGMGFRSNKKEEAIAEEEEAWPSSLAETERALERLRHGVHNKNEDVDQEAETFIQLEHRRMNLTKLLSMRPF